MSLIVDLFNEKQARDEVRILEQKDVDYVEVNTTLTPELYWAIADEAKSQNFLLLVTYRPRSLPGTL